MVKMKIAGIMIEVYPADVDFYKRAGYSMVTAEVDAGPVEAGKEPEAEKEPVAKKAKK